MLCHLSLSICLEPHIIKAFSHATAVHNLLGFSIVLARGADRLCGLRPQTLLRATGVNELDSPQIE